ncbi:CASP-like protein 2A2 [Zea mays]|uniref:CASP-like protein n=2 Tax=Zea mays TaxID=4577 RepID=K7TSJ3_MAIZE|nr:CASP-like protein 2A2 [Zea mays]ACF84708.1 unknown [Zea mays]AQK43035.1 CASP-like protein 7 [Zea mays]PWZ43674.1 CASP-like protein 2A2 [Zea mays]|eukprot:NP_001140819.1 CASP-like protein 2A2 [Zea mays]
MSKTAGVGRLGGAGAADAAQQQQLAAGDAAVARAARPIETLLRAAPLVLCVAAMTLMLRDQQSNEYGTVAYSDLGGFKYLVYANGLCAAYSLASAFYTAVPRPATVSRSWVVFLLDQVFTYLILAAGAAAAELLYLAYNGDKEVTWSEACGVFGSFCRQARTSVAITFGAVLCFILLSLLSSYRLFSAYEAPPPSALGSKGVEIAAYPR